METNNLTAPIAVEKDRNTLTIELMNRMKLHGMAAAFTESLTSTMAEPLQGLPRADRLCNPAWP